MYFLVFRRCGNRLLMLTTSVVDIYCYNAQSIHQSSRVAYDFEIVELTIVDVGPMNAKIMYMPSLQQFIPSVSPFLKKKQYSQLSQVNCHSYQVSHRNCQISFMMKLIYKVIEIDSRVFWDNYTKINHFVRSSMASWSRSSSKSSLRWIRKLMKISLNDNCRTGDLTVKIL